MHSTGLVPLATKQATKGRSQVGGIRLGETDRFCIVAYDVSDLFLERLDIDLSKFLICLQCGELIDLEYDR